MRRLRSFNCLLLLLHACLSTSASLLSTGAVPIPSTWPYGASNAITWKKETTQTLVFRPLSHWRHYKLPLTQYYQPVEMFLFLFGPFKRNENQLYFFCLVSFLFRLLLTNRWGRRSLASAGVWGARETYGEAATQLTCFDSNNENLFLFSPLIARSILTTFWNSAGLGQDSNKRHFDVLLINPRISP
jgi:hypothetical protein